MLAEEWRSGSQRWRKALPLHAQRHRSHSECATRPGSSFGPDGCDNKVVDTATSQCGKMVTGGDGMASAGQRRLKATLLGALGGLVGGIGATTVVLQSGRVHIDVGGPVVLSTVIGGAVIGLIEPPAWLDRAIALTLIAGTILIGVIGVGQPTHAQNTCSVIVSAGDGERDLARTRPGDPFVIDVGSEPTIAFRARAPDLDHGLIEVVVVGTGPIEQIRPSGDQVVYFDEILDGEVSGSLRVVRSGVTGFRLIGDGYDSPLAPLGVVELAITVTDLDASNALVQSCPRSAWVQAVARPADNPIGLAGMGLTFVGVAVVGAAGPGRRYRDRTVGTPPVRYEPIGAAGPHAEHTEVRICDAAGNQIDPAAGLIAGHDYKISITFGPTLDDEDADLPEAELTGVATSRSLGISAEISVGVPGIPISFSLTPRQVGRHRVSIDATHRGHHIQTQRVEFSVVDRATTPVEPQSTTTLIATAVPTADELEDLPSRPVLIVLEYDPRDGSVDARIRDEHGDTIVSYDSVLQSEALDQASANARQALQGVLASSQPRLDLDRNDLSELVTPVVAAGQRLAMALFPDANVREGDAERLSTLVADGATVQIVAHGAGLGHATLPWALVHDQPFIERGAGNPVCDSFENHPVDACPNAGATEMWCPTGFWGYRSVIEELWGSTEPDGVQPVRRGGADADLTSVVAYLDPDLPAAGVQTRTTRRLGARHLTDFDQILAWLDGDDAGLDLVYLFAHHHDGPGGGVRVGDDVLSASTVNTKRRRRVECWPNRPIVIVNGCASGAYTTTDPVSLLAEFRAFGAGGAVTTECTVWDGVAGECGLRILDGLANGDSIGAVLTSLRRNLLREHHNPAGFAYKLLAQADRARSERAVAEEVG